MTNTIASQGPSPFNRKVNIPSSKVIVFRCYRDKTKRSLFVIRLYIRTNVLIEKYGKRVQFSLGMTRKKKFKLQRYEKQ